MKKTITWVFILLILVGGGYLLSYFGRAKLISDGEMVQFSAMGFKPGSLDPATHNTAGAEVIIKHIYDTLYDYAYLIRPYEMVPVLADGMPEVSDDGLTYVIRIKKGIFFTDDECFEGGKGRELVADDFIYQWKRVANIKTASPSWWVMDGRIVGLNEFREYTKTVNADEVDYSLSVEGLQALDSHTLVIKLTKPWPHMVYNLSKTSMTGVAKEAVDHYGKSVVNHPIGTGPFRLKRWNKESYIELERNVKFDYQLYPTCGEPEDVAEGLLADAGKKIPFIDRIYFMKIEEEPPAWFLFLKGKLDSTSIPKDNFSQVIAKGTELTEDMKKRNIVLKTYKTPDTQWIGFNMNDPVLGDNIYLRKAISWGMDRDKFIELFANGILDEAWGLIPPLMKSYDPNGNVLAGYDLVKAKEFVTLAKKQQGGAIPELTLKIPGTSVTERQYGQFFQKQFANIGLKLTVDYLDVPTYYSQLRKGQFQMYLGGVSSSAPIAYNILRMFHSQSIGSGNYFYYQNPDFDRIFDESSVMFDSPERTELYRKCERKLVEDCVAVFIFHGVSYTLEHSWVENYKPSALQYGLARFIRIDSEKRKLYQEMF